MDPGIRDWYVDLGNNKTFLVVRANDGLPLTSAECDWLQRVVNQAVEPAEINNPDAESPFPHPQAKRIVREILPAAVERYLGKAGDYGDDEPELGAAGEFAQIYGKVRKIKRVLWHGHTLSGEPPIEVLEDLIAHVALAIDYVKRNNLNAPDPRD